MRFTTTSVHQPQGSKMQIQTILNRVEKQKGFVYSKASFNKKGELEIQVRPRSNSRAICSGCGKSGSTYDHSSIRQFQFVPLWGIAVFLVYAMRRVNCKECGVTTERVPCTACMSKLSSTFPGTIAVPESPPFSQPNFESKASPPCVFPFSAEWHWRQRSVSNGRIFDSKNASSVSA